MHRTGTAGTGYGRIAPSLAGARERAEWWLLVPDQTIFAKGCITTGKILNLAARHKDGRWVMVYLGSKSSFSLDMNKLVPGNLVNASWIEPATGKPTPAGPVSRAGPQSFTTPAGWEDALLILEASEK